MNGQPIAYTYEADYHCYACTIARFPTTEGIDRDGNDVGAVFSWDDWRDEDGNGLYCGDCHECIRA